ncbi:hypothetical protein [Thalassotalea sp. PS06]|uniref:hypothetical protein n=1 Tax=Thalassotalea sp. PS06 TaxID=2594005 RepID=UPI00163D5CF2|nr:hypothetical protein [Thalassotalea sp. PS06]
MKEQQPLKTCKIYAEEDGVTPDEMTTYLLECVNDDMEMSGYKHLTKLPTKTAE